MKKYRIAVIPGDNIGPEVMEASLAVLEAVQKADGGFTLELETCLAGAAYYTDHGTAMSDDAIAVCRAADSVFKAPVGDPAVRTPEGIEGGLLGGVLRTGLDLYANVRPVKLYPGVPTPLHGYQPGGIDYVIIRENTEGLYASRGKGVGEKTRRRTGGRRAPGDLCREKQCSSLLRLLPRDFPRNRRGIPRYRGETIYPDAAAQALVMNPAHYDVLVMENFLGDILSDLGGGTIGGLGMCPGGNIGDHYAYFEPVHGSAPDIVGQGIVNPASQILAGAMMLNHIGEESAARRIEDAIWRALEEEELSIDERGRAGRDTMAAAEAVVARL